MDEELDPGWRRRRRILQLSAHKPVDFPQTPGRRPDVHPRAFRRKPMKRKLASIVASCCVVALGTAARAAEDDDKVREDLAERKVF